MQYKTTVKEIIEEKGKPTASPGSLHVEAGHNLTHALSQMFATNMQRCAFLPSFSWCFGRC